MILPRNHLRNLIVSWSTLALGLALVVSPAAARPPDAWVTAKAKLALIASDKVGGTHVDVDTFNGRVTLHGKVRSAEEKAEAARLAARIDGVREVRNLLQVVPEGALKQVRATDKQIEERVERALEHDPELSNSHITVKSVDKGVVLLAGKAKSFSDHVRAVEVADHVSGVRRVASEIASPNQYGDDEMWRSNAAASVERPQHGRKARGAQPQRANDAWITTQARLKFMTDPHLPASDISLDSYDGRVVVFGMVPSAAERVQALNDVRKISGVRSVEDHLRIVPRSEQKVVKRDDRAIESSIKSSLAEAAIPGARIKVDVKAGVAHLEGTVRNPSDRYTAMASARSTDGVRVVEDDIRIEGQRASR